MALIKKKTISIAIDTIFFQMSYSGITRVWETLFKNLPGNTTTTNNNTNTNTNTYEITILQRSFSNGNLNPNGYKFKPELNIDKKYKVLQINEFNYMTMNQDVDYLNHLCKIHKFDIFISTYYTYTTVVPNVLLIHDMIPEVFKLAPTNMWKQKDKAIRNASSFITISKTSKDDLIKFYPHIKNDNYPVEIIYNAIPEYNSTNNPTLYNDDLLKHNNIKPQSYIFAMASNNEPYKNISLIKALATKYGKELSTMLNNPIPIIMLCSQQFPNGYNVEGNILYLSKVPDALLNALYKNALCFVCPSLYEGFGLPIFEAFVRSVPVIAIKNEIFKELGGGGINFIENTESSLYEKIQFIKKNEGSSVTKRVEFGLQQAAKFTESIQSDKWNTYFSNLQETLLTPKPFINIILQSYKETNLDRLKELEYCIRRNLENPYVKSIHDFGEGLIGDIPSSSLGPKYHFVNNPGNKWLTFDMAIRYANEKSVAVDVAVDIPVPNERNNYWCIINLDIFLDSESPWDLIRGRLNDGFVYAQSRHEFDILSNGKKVIKMDDNFARMYHANTQDAWLFKTPVNIDSTDKNSYDFELGFLGCDNAIAERLVKNGYNVINQPVTYKIFHYDIAKGKTSSNYMEKHAKETKAMEAKNIKPKNKYPERIGSYLVPNYDQLVGNNQDIDFLNIIRGLGGCSNWERYEFISKLLSDRVIISNP